MGVKWVGFLGEREGVGGKGEIESDGVWVQSDKARRLFCVFGNV